MNVVKLKLKQASHGALSFRIKDRLLITGFWRSGTTWLQQSVQSLTSAHTVFEPFSPACGYVWDGFAKYDDDANHHIFMPVEMSFLAETDHDNLKRSFNGVAPNGYGYILSPNFGDVWSKNIIVKSTRLGFILPEILERHQVKTLHIRRHPAAVYCSMLNTNWSWQFPDVRFEKVYAKHFGSAPMIGKLLDHDHSVVTRFAALWALSESRAQKAIDLNLADLIRYEDLTQAPGSLSSYILDAQTPTAPKTETKNSPVTEDNRKDLSADQRAHDWRDRISKTDLATLQEIVLKLAPEIHEQYTW